MMKKKYYQKLAFLGMLLVLLFTYKKYTARKIEKFPELKFISEKSSLNSLTEFNPNDLDENQWSKLGFSEKQIATILNYKKIVGGTFLSKEQLKKCYAISEDKYNELENYILLPKTNSEAKSSAYKSQNYEKKTLKISKKFNPDLLSQNDWEMMGFTEKQASAILKYKQYLGGSFVSKEKLKDCFIINDENYQKMAPFLILPEKTPENYRSFAKNLKTEKQIHYSNFDPNILDFEGWKNLGFSEKQATVIVNYRDKNLKGSFKTIDDIKNCFVISADKFEELKPFIKINSTTITKNNADKKPENLQQEKTDFSKIDLNSISFKQLLEFGLDEKSAGSMIGFRKKLGGFMTKEQILDTYNIDKELVQKLISTAYLDNSKVEKHSLVDAPEEWLKNHPYFKYSADKIIYYRISYPDDKKIWKNLKVKPEYEAKMRLYLK